MTPQEIALEAAEQIANWLGDVTESDRQHIAAIILTAAAKIVRESGAVEAFKVGQQDAMDMLAMIEDYDALEYGEDGPPFTPCIDELQERIEQRDAALAKLRAIGEGKP